MKTLAMIIGFRSRRVTYEGAEHSVKDIYVEYLDPAVDGCACAKLEAWDNSEDLSYGKVCYMFWSKKRYSWRYDRLVDDMDISNAKSQLASQLG